ncbi:MAG: DUF2877 domain-containing protein [Ktedonobacteraceae bacterium]
MPVSGGWTLTRASSYSTYVALVARGAAQRGVIHSVFPAAANIIFPGDFVLSLNAISSPRMPNGLQLSTPPGTFPFPVLRAGMPVLFGAQRLLIEAVDCSFDLSCCSEWDPHIERPDQLDMKVVAKNKEWLLKHVSALDLQLTWDQPVHNVRSMAQYLCGRGVGLTPTGDDILAGWMAVNWLLYGPLTCFLEACQQIVAVAKQQTHLLSQCWLSYAATGDVATPIKALLDALTKEDDAQLAASMEAVLSMGATSGRDLIQGIVLGLVG